MPKDLLTNMLAKSMGLTKKYNTAFDACQKGMFLVGQSVCVVITKGNPVCVR